jgi:hypothetical protein
MIFNFDNDPVAKNFKRFGVYMSTWHQRQSIDAYGCAIAIIANDDRPVEDSAVNVLHAVLHALEHGYRGIASTMTDEMAERWLAIANVELGLRGMEDPYYDEGDNN